MTAVVAAAACCYCCYSGSESASRKSERGMLLLRQRELLLPKSERGTSIKERGGRDCEKVGCIGLICKDRWGITMKTKR